MGIFNRIFKVGEAEAHAAIDKLENPIKMTEQGIRDLKKDLDTGLQALAEVKALAIRSRREANENKENAQSYEQKAILILGKAEKGDITPDEADRLAGEALTRKEECVSNAARAQTEVESFDQNIAKLQSNINRLKSQIRHYENELKTLKARDRVSSATTKINKSMSGIDSSSTVARLERMKDKVNQQEAMAEAYGDIASESRSVDDEIDDVLKDEPKSKASDALADLKAKLNK
ncbi:MAG: PspA/IM30 family protein [Salinivirgaceae bacterium]|jgi:phage shock protein A|nr:PspA/IM30 family protein [Salinivirgaceae bacterium]